MKTVHILFRDFIYAAGVPGMTAQQPAYCHCATAQSAVTLEGSNCVTGAGRMEPAVPADPWTQQKAIDLDELY
jgi:hypothetical protein